MDTESPSRRQRYRQQTLAEIKAEAAAQVAEGGPAAVSLNAIAKSMGMSPGALYRYFDNRDDLLAELVVDAYDDLADHLEKAAAAARSTHPRCGTSPAPTAPGRSTSPNSYRLIFETTIGSGHDLAPDRIVPASQRSMNVFLAALADRQSDDHPGPSPGTPHPAGAVGRTSRDRRPTHSPLPGAHVVEPLARPDQPGARRPHIGHRSRSRAAVRGRDPATHPLANCGRRSNLWPQRPDALPGHESTDLGRAHRAAVRGFEWTRRTDQPDRNRETVWAKRRSRATEMWPRPSMIVSSHPGIKRAVSSKSWRE